MTGTIDTKCLLKSENISMSDASANTRTAQSTCGEWIKAWVVLAAQKDKMVDLWRRKCCCGSARNAFIPHYVAAIQYSEHDLGKTAWYAGEDE